jgi:hypothetical protein
MSTRATISVAWGPVIKAITVHWDGYPEHVGKVLQEHFASDHANALVALGNLSSLAPKIEPSKDSGHTFDKPEKGVCVFYGRDRGESRTQFSTFNSLKDMVNSYSHCEFHYLMENGQWLVSDGGDAFEPLAEVLTASET